MANNLLVTSSSAFLCEDIRVLIKIALGFFPRCSIDSNSELLRSWSDTEQAASAYLNNADLGL